MPAARTIARLIRRALIVGHSSTWPRRLVPLPLMTVLIELYSRVQQRGRRLHWRTSRDFHRELLRFTPLAGTEEAVARRSVVEWYRCAELFWRPWLMRRGEIRGIEHLEAARAEGRGIAGVFPHFGIPYAQFPIMRRYGVDAWVIASPRHYEDLGDGYDARMTRRGKAYVDMLGPGRAIVRLPGQAAFDCALQTLRDGALVSVAFDLPGSTPTPFLGRMVSLVSGPSQLAHQADAVVLPFILRVGHDRPVLEFAAPIDSRDHADPAALQAAIALVFERWALERPEAVWPSPSPAHGPLLISGPTLAAAQV